MIELPKEEYEHIGNVTYCTLRQMCLHTIGLDRYGKTYTRHGKKYYKPYRNYFNGASSELDKLVEAGYMDFEDDTYSLNRKGLD